MSKKRAENAFAKSTLDAKEIWLKTVIELIENPFCDALTLSKLGAHPEEFDTLDLRRQLLNLPFEFRAKAYVCWTKKFQVFGKCPVFISLKGENEGRVAGLVRPISCPEPAPTGCHFIFAWLEGSRWFLENGREDLTPASSTWAKGTRFKAVDRINEAERAVSKKSATRIEYYRHILEAPPPSTENAAAEIEKFLRSFDKPLYDEFRKILFNSFAVGVEFARNVLYPMADEAVAKERMKATTEEWPSIIAHAMNRHPDSTEANLLRELGSINPDLPQRSEELLQFEWPFAPAIRRKDFHEKYRYILKKATGEKPDEMKMLHSFLIESVQKKIKDQRNYRSRKATREQDRSLAKKSRDTAKARQAAKKAPNW